MPVDFYYKQGDTAPAVSSQLLDGSGAPVDLTDATVGFVLRPLGDIAVLVSGAAQPGEDPTDGWVYYWPQPGDFDTAGTYVVEWTVTFPDGRVEHYPPDRMLLLLIGPTATGAPTITDADLDWLRSWLGTTPESDVLATLLDRHGDRTTVALMVLRQRRLELLAGPVSYTIPGDISVNMAGNLKGLDDTIAQLEALAAADANGEDGGVLGAVLVRRGGGWGRDRYGRR